METIILGVIAVIEFIYILLQDLLNRRERERLISVFPSSGNVIQDKRKPAGDKSETTSPPPKPNPYVPIEDVSIETLLNAKDRM